MVALHRTFKTITSIFERWDRWGVKLAGEHQLKSWHETKRGLHWHPVAKCKMIQIVHILYTIWALECSRYSYSLYIESASCLYLPTSFLICQHFTWLFISTMQGDLCVAQQFACVFLNQNLVTEESPVLLIVDLHKSNGKLILPWF